MQYQTQSRPATAGRTFDTIAAPTLVGAGRGLFTGALQSNPLVALGALLISPILGLFRKRAVAPREINQLKLESYSSKPITPPGQRRYGPRSNAVRDQSETSASAVYTPHIAATEDAYRPYGESTEPVRSPYGQSTERVRSRYGERTEKVRRKGPPAASALSGKGGRHHG